MLFSLGFISLELYLCWDTVLPAMVEKNTKGFLLPVSSLIFSKFDKRSIRNVLANVLTNIFKGKL